MTDASRYPLADRDGCQNDKQNHGNLTPGEHVEGSLKLKTQAAGADQAKNGGFADVDIPTINTDAGKGRRHLRDDGVIEHLQPRTSRGYDRVHLALVDLFDRFVEQLGDEADGAQGDGDDASENSGTYDCDQ